MISGHPLFARKSFASVSIDVKPAAFDLPYCVHPVRRPSYGMIRLVLLAAFFLAVPAPVMAQSDSLLTSILIDTTRAGPLQPAAMQKSPVRSIRLASSSGGFIFGMVIGGFLGSQLLQQDHENNKNAQIDALMIGGAIGGAAGAAFGTAFLDLSSVCSFGGRFARTVIGASAGGATLFFASGGLKRGGRSAFFVPIGAVAGSLGSLGRCWKSRY
jgi:hypothetical protein